MNWKKLEKRLLELGGSARVPRRNGEREWSHPLMDKPVRFNQRRKDCPRTAMVFVKRVEEKVSN